MYWYACTPYTVKPGQFNSLWRQHISFSYTEKEGFFELVMVEKVQLSLNKELMSFSNEMLLQWVDKAGWAHLCLLKTLNFKCVDVNLVEEEENEEKGWTSLNAKKIFVTSESCVLCGLLWCICLKNYVVLQQYCHQLGTVMYINLPNHS